MTFDEIDEGDELPYEEIFLSKEAVRAYAHAAGIAFPRFTEDEGARREGLPGMIAPGNMSMGTCLPASSAGRDRGRLPGSARRSAVSSFPTTRCGCVRW